jgi:uncharacterized RDD family membrane protein YckC
MRDARPEGSPYPKADLTLRALARVADFALAFVVARALPQVGPIIAAFYLIVADGLMNGQSVGKRIFGVRTVVVPRRAPAGYRESVLRNAPFALVAIFWALPLFWPMLVVAGLPIVGFEAYMIFTDRLGIRIGDIFADTQVVDAKVLSKAGEIAHGIRPIASPPPSSSPTATRSGVWPPSRAAA